MEDKEVIDINISITTIINSVKAIDTFHKNVLNEFHKRIWVDAAQASVKISQQICNLAQDVLKK